MSALYRPTLLLGAASLVAACTVAQMRAPSSLANQEPWPVQGHSPRWRSDSLAFGPYRANAVNEGTRLDWAIELFDTKSQLAGAERIFAFDLGRHDEARGGEVVCRESSLGIKKRGYEIDVSGALRPLLDCTIRNDRGTATLSLDAIGNEFRGELDGRSNRRFTIRSVHAFADSNWPSAEPLGFEFSQFGHFVSAIETINAGRVWLAVGLESNDEFDLVAATAALLFFRPDGGEAP